MLNQKTLLRIILFSLGIAAVVGAFGILFARSTVIGQIDGTLVLTAICCGVLLWVFRKSAAEDEPRSLLLATALVAIEFGLGCVAIWSGELFENTSLAAVAAMGAFAVTGIAAVVFLKIEKAPATRIAARTGLVFSAIVLLIWLWGIALFWNDVSAWALFAYGCTAGCCGILTTAALAGVGVDRRHWRWIGIVCSFAGLFIAVKYIHASSEWHTQPLLALVTISVLIAHANLALRCPLKANQRWLAYATVIAVAASCAFANLSAYNNSGSGWDDSVFDRLAGACVILASCGTLALAILYRINRRLKTAGEKLNELDSIAVVCPVCQRKQTINGGSGTCDGCGLIITFKLEEPRCAACGYSLLMFKGDKCPECGAVIFAQRKSRGASSVGAVSSQS